MLQVLRTATLFKRDSNTAFYLWILWIIQKHLFCVEDLWTASCETPGRLFKKCLLLTVSGFQTATLLKKRLQQRFFSVNFAKLLRTFFDRTLSDDCFLCLSVNLEFSRSPRFYRVLLGNWLFHVQVAEFQPPDAIKSISQVLFKRCNKNET